jgi:hypothetical protein
MEEYQAVQLREVFEWMVCPCSRVVHTCAVLRAVRGGGSICGGDVWSGKTPVSMKKDITNTEIILILLEAIFTIPLALLFHWTRLKDATFYLIDLNERLERIDQLLDDRDEERRSSKKSST